VRRALFLVRRSSLASRIDIVALAIHPDRVQEVLDSLKLSDGSEARFQSCLVPPANSLVIQISLNSPNLPCLGSGVDLSCRPHPE